MKLKNIKMGWVKKKVTQVDSLTLQPEGVYELVRRCCRYDGCGCGRSTNGGVFLRARTWRAHNTCTVKFFAQKAKTIPAQSRDDLEYKEMI